MKYLTILALFLGIILSLSGGDAWADPPFPLPRMPICGDEDDPLDPPVFNCPDYVPIEDIKLFQVPGIGPVVQGFDFVYAGTILENELLVFEVDDATGAIAGLAPGSPGYLAEAFARAQIVFPKGSDPFTPDVNLVFSGGDYLAFLIVQDDTLVNLLANNPTNNVNGSPVAFFSIDAQNPDTVDHFVGFESLSSANTQFGFEDLTYGGDSDYDDVVFNVDPPLTPACPDGHWYGEFFDNRDLLGDPVLIRCDANIDFLWGPGAPSTALPTDNFSIRWQRVVDITQTGTYRFRTFTDDGLRLYVDGGLKIDDWTERSFAERSAIVTLAAGPHVVRLEYVEWSDDALANLQWYRCPNGTGDCNLNVTPDYQTRYLDVALPAGCTTVANQTIASWGSQLTSLAMALQRIGIAVDTNQLNGLLSQETGAYPSDCDARLQSPDFVTKVVFDNFGVRFAWSPVYTVAGALAAIRNNHPVIMHNSGSGHFFLAVDAAEVGGVTLLGINDPHHAHVCRAVSAGPPPPVASILDCMFTSPVPVVQHELTTAGRFSGASPIGYLSQTQQPHEPSLTIQATSAQILLTDASGRRVGHNAASGQSLFEIPRAFYYDSKITPPGDIVDNVLERTLFLPESAAGTFILRVIGVSATNPQFNLQLTGFGSQFSLHAASKTGTLLPGQTVDYVVRFIPGQSLSIYPVAQLLLPAAFSQ